MNTMNPRPWSASYDPWVPETIRYPKIALFKILTATSTRFPDNPAITFFGKQMTYRELKNRVNRFAASLHRIGVKKGTRVALMLPNTPQMVISYYAVLSLGGVVVNVSPLYVEREIEHQVTDSGAEFMVVLDILYPRVRNVRAQTPLKEVILTRIPEYLPGMLKILFPLILKIKGEAPDRNLETDVRYFPDLIAEPGDEAPEVEVAPDDLALLQYTGGTTGTAKGAMLTHANLVANTFQCLALASEFARPGEETFLDVIPFFHVYGMTIGMNVAIALGSHMILFPRFDLKMILRGIRKYQPTFFPGVPTIYTAIANHPDVEKYKVGSIKLCNSGAAPLSLETLHQFEKVTGGLITEGYGLTEASPVTHGNPILNPRKAGSIGIPVPDTEVKIVDIDSGEKELPAGEEGELCIRGPQVMKGYWNRPEETAEVLRDGWLHTGDIAKMDEEGYFYIVDRKKDLIIAGGYNITPREVDEVLFQHPKVLEAVTVGVPDQYRGETVKAYVVLKEGETATPEEIISFCKERLAPFKVPKVVEFRPELPKTMVGKVLRRVLREEEIKKQKEKG